LLIGLAAALDFDFPENRHFLAKWTSPWFHFLTTMAVDDRRIGKNERRQGLWRARPFSRKSEPGEPVGGS
jgi:hypothetical protein